MAWHCRRTKSAILVSRSRDGEYIARIAAALGYRPVRGSSSRGRPVTITPDGPRGPRYDIKPGLLALARNSGCDIIPAAMGLSAYWELPSWDRFRIPKPFSRGVHCWGEPLRVPPDADEAALGRLAQELRRRMIALEAHADRKARELAAGPRPVDSPDGV